MKSKFIAIVRDTSDRSNKIIATGNGSSRRIALQRAMIDLANATDVAVKGPGSNDLIWDRLRIRVYKQTTVSPIKAVI